MLYKPVDKSLNFKDRELEVLEFWKQNRIFEKTVAQGKGKPAYTFLRRAARPPTASRTSATY